MKQLYVRFILFFAFIALVSFVPDHFLLAEHFFLKKGDTLSLHLLLGENLAGESELHYTAKQTTKFNIYEGKKVTDLTKVVKDNAQPLLKYNVSNDGPVLVSLNNNELNEIPREDFLAFLTEQGYDDIADKLKNSNALNFTEKCNRYIKTLLTVGDGGGNEHSKVVGDDFEIVLKKNPYKLNYGEDLTATVTFKGKPYDGPVWVYIKASSGNIYPQKLNTDPQGRVYMNISREGVYMLRATKFEASKGKEADYESWVASYIFSFRNHDDEPNTYKEFGFGDKH
ncbi:DUF4198 domain-containing protein [Mucilaginibacter conchicola]|uniref:DUF4198 domain-containing protein n=1 Tax=Mucilaginibacter conchicola TaxID=2303333 RepID=A0A372NSI0_9SPHI|nr:DUF4198 domain-containing protein [Mucilaginibacter conchicola]RFZ92205.1 DUF4198 domain-containing protein [Mucilaginibacter conchicola]